MHSEKEVIDYNESRYNLREKKVRVSVRERKCLECDNGDKHCLHGNPSISGLAQAHLNAVSMRDDYIAEALLSLQKVSCHCFPCSYPSLPLSRFSFSYAPLLSPSNPLTIRCPCWFMS